MHMAGGDTQGGRGDAGASCASPLGTPLHPALQNMKIMYFFLFLWVIFALLDPDPDPQFECGSGSGNSN
jgi:hypothetical protein